MSHNAFYGRNIMTSIPMVLTVHDFGGEYFDAVHFTDVVDKYPIHGRRVYACYGNVTEEFGHYSLNIIWSKKMPLKPDPRSPEEATFRNIDMFRHERRKQVKS